METTVNGRGKEVDGNSAENQMKNGIEMRLQSGK
jgi:hypothetical protein